MSRADSETAIDLAPGETSAFLDGEVSFGLTSLLVDIYEILNLDVNTRIFTANVVHTWAIEKFHTLLQFSKGHDGTKARTEPALFRS